MKIVMVNNHYFNYRGADRYFFNVKTGLEKAGHEIIPFSFHYDATQETPYLPYFPEPITGRGPFLIKDMRLSPAAKVKTAVKMFRNSESDERFKALLRHTRPDLVYFIYLSFTFRPNLLRIAKELFGLPVLYRLSDYHMFCASYLFFRNGRACTECLSRPWAVVRHKCVQDSLPGSALRALQILYNRWRGYYRSVDFFLCPSRYMQETLIRYAAFPPSKVMHLPTFTTDLFQEEGPSPSARPYILYFGAIIPAKGMDVLLKAYNLIPQPALGLKLVGDVECGYRRHLEDLLDETHRPLVSFDGELKGEDLWRALRGCSCVVHPVLWFENMPNSILEAMSAGKPVVASDIGSMPELVEEGVNGRLVPPGDEKALSQALEMAADPEWTAKMGQGARARYLQNHLPQGHLNKLMGLMEQLVPSKGQDAPF
ncbi:MAG TPA: glycosyltransferase family 4 protein [bacterium]|nr:glycosyltransferase family 4 protein [bacterium]